MARQCGEGSGEVGMAEREKGDGGEGEGRGGGGRSEEKVREKRKEKRRLAKLGRESSRNAIGGGEMEGDVEEERDQDAIAMAWF